MPRRRWRRRSARPRRPWRRAHHRSNDAPSCCRSSSHSCAFCAGSVEDLKTMAPKLNPIVGYWNPLSLGETSLGSAYDAEQAIGLCAAPPRHKRFPSYVA
ncbi:hypothetical protein OAO87_03755 [bacterium]|nr:hypothetical protein [bacterium]